jgi:hypothetical protein
MGAKDEGAPTMPTISRLALENLADLAADAGDNTRALKLLEEALAVAQENGDQHGSGGYGEPFDFRCLFPTRIRSGRGAPE